MRKLLFMALFIICAVSALGVQKDVLNKGSIPLLALTENATGSTGTIARLDLELRPGANRVFLETFPMTIVSTQASLRFAQQVACKELEIRCSDKDFLFKIHALPGIVGGPSAGGAASVLVASLLLNKTFPEDIAMTGTINSGGTIGPVGGVKLKLEAAAGNNIKTVLIPKGTRMFKEDNVTVDLVEYGSKLNLNVIEIATFAEAVEIILGVKLPTLDGTLKIQDRYKNTMRDVAIDLCSRSDSLIPEVQETNISEALDFTERGNDAFQQSAYYSSASYCFRANVLLRQAIFNKTYGGSEQELSGVLNELQEEASRIKAAYAEEDVNTITNLQTYMAVMERIVEAEGVLKDSKELLGKNNTQVSDNLAYAKERLFSAVTWSRFFHGEDERIVINVARLKQSCISKIAEAEERYNYAKLLLPEGLAKTKEYITNAYIYLNKKNYILCLHSASKAKSESDVILSLLGVKEEFLKDVIDLKLQVARQALIKAQIKDVFPIIAYSYYEYANSLRDFDNFSALLFAEYALELSNLDIYFEEPTIVQVQEKTRLPQLAIGIIVGFLIGVIIARFVISPRPKLATVTLETIKKPIKKPTKKPKVPGKKS